MKCPYCGGEVAGRICMYCKSEHPDYLKRMEAEARIKQLQQSQNSGFSNSYMYNNWEDEDSGNTVFESTFNNHPVIHEEERKEEVNRVKKSIRSFFGF